MPYAVDAYPNATLCIKTHSLRGKGNIGHFYSAANMSQTQDLQCFIISDMAADWHEIMVLHAAIHCSC